MRQQQLRFGLEGKSQLRLGAMVHEAWTLSRQPSPWFALLTLAWLLIIYGCVDQLPALLMARGMADNQAQGLAALLATIISAPVSASLDVMGLKVALGQRVDGRELRQCVVRSGRIIALALLFTLLVDLGLQLLLPGLFLLVCASISNLVLIYFSANPFNALLWSIRAGFFRFGALALALLIGALAMALGVMSFGLLLIWLAPFAMILRGILFRELFGVAEVQPASPATDKRVQPASSDGSFEA